MPIRPAKYASEANFFKKRPDVPSFHEGGLIVYNPFHPYWREGIENERARVALRARRGGGPSELLAMPIEAHQRRFFDRYRRRALSAEATDDDIRATIAARIATGDPSLAPHSGGQVFWASQALGDFMHRRGDDENFMPWAIARALLTGTNRNPDDPRQEYDYREAYHAGVEPQPYYGGHWPSEYKEENHPNRFVGGRDTLRGAIETLMRH